MSDDKSPLEDIDESEVDKHAVYYDYEEEFEEWLELFKM